MALLLTLTQGVTAQIRTLNAVAVAGKRYVALKDLAAMYGLPLSFPGGKTILIHGKYNRLQFGADSRQAVINGSLVWLHMPITSIKGVWSISDADAQFVVDPLVRPSVYLAGRQSRTVVLDPGHGGKDPGALSRTGASEKEMVLDIARRAKKHLEAAGVRVVMTRDKDQFWELSDRCYLAARGGGDAFVSIHLNSSSTRSVQGIETFVTAAENYPPTAAVRVAGRYPAVPNNRFNHSNTALGNQLQRALVGITRAPDRGLKRSRFIVLRDAPMPAALVECGFLSNPQEEQKLLTPSYRETLGLGIAQGVLNYFALVNRARKTTASDTTTASPEPLLADVVIPAASGAPPPEPVLPAPPAIPPAAAIPPLAAASFQPLPLPVSPVSNSPPVRRLSSAASGTPPRTDLYCPPPPGMLNLLFFNRAGE